LLFAAPQKHEPLALQAANARLNSPEIRRRRAAASLESSSGTRLRDDSRRMLLNASPPPSTKTVEPAPLRFHPVYMLDNANTAFANSLKVRTMLIVSTPGSAASNPSLAQSSLEDAVLVHSSRRAPSCHELAAHTVASPCQQLRTVLRRAVQRAWRASHVRERAPHLTPWTPPCATRCRALQSDVMPHAMRALKRALYVRAPVPADDTLKLPRHCQEHWVGNGDPCKVAFSIDDAACSGKLPQKVPTELFGDIQCASILLHCP
jgi:hypothetical protein